jgi:hypothetical protein
MSSNHIYAPIPYRHPLLTSNVDCLYKNQLLQIKLPILNNPSHYLGIINKLINDMKSISKDDTILKEPIKIQNTETKIECIYGINCKNHSKKHHEKYVHLPIKCKFGDDCKFFKINKCNYIH